MKEGNVSWCSAYFFLFILYYLLARSLIFMSWNISPDCFQMNLMYDLLRELLSHSIEKGNVVFRGRESSFPPMYIHKRCVTQTRRYSQLVFAQLYMCLCLNISDHCSMWSRARVVKTILDDWELFQVIPLLGLMTWPSFLYSLQR